MLLRHLLKDMPIHEFHGDLEMDIGGIAYDSRAVRPGDLFVAIKGRELNGHDYINMAIEKGAKAVVAEGAAEVGADIAIIRVSDPREVLSRLAVRFYDTPFEGMNLIGVTGTNGKTSTSYLLESILFAAGARPGVIGTVNYRFQGHTCRAPVTTPESLDLMRMLRRMADSGVTDVVMEVSSHAIHQGRTAACPFRVAIFTNLSRDHLDYHVSMGAYFEAKRRLFRELGKNRTDNLARAVINWDDPRGPELTEATEAEVITYGLGKGCDVRAVGLEGNGDGLRARLVTRWGEQDIRSSLIGAVNIYNILAASAAALSMDMDLHVVASGIKALKGIPGRLERVRNSRSLVLVVDYAHTPDALSNALDSLRPIAPGRVITVFGCGGDRDKGKRREMGQVAAEKSDVVFITSDNPRSEDPAAIAAQILEGVRESGMKRLAEDSLNGSRGTGYVLDLDRRSAIQRAVGMAREDDLILIAGKGHEDYQIVGKEKRPFDDRVVAAESVGG
jgi:UDP-N-acetylmuramoyl-L-alanyl-D-glutamate--2,6-diaminopimelate ligase